jgi:ferrous iron transport protein A
MGACTQAGSEIAVTRPVKDVDGCAVVPLGQARLGFRGRVDSVHVNGNAVGMPPAELEMRLIEIGFVEGAQVEILHEGAFGHDPIAVRINQSTIALRRREAMAILVRPLDRRS